MKSSHSSFVFCFCLYLCLCVQLLGLMLAKYVPDATKLSSRSWESTFVTQKPLTFLSVCCVCLCMCLCLQLLGLMLENMLKCHQVQQLCLL
jgi:hypothetical protein